jgi:hypothetical protein
VVSDEHVKLTEQRDTEGKANVEEAYATHTLAQWLTVTRTCMSWKIVLGSPFQLTSRRLVPTRKSSSRVESLRYDFSHCSLNFFFPLCSLIRRSSLSLLNICIAGSIINEMCPSQGSCVVSLSDRTSSMWGPWRPHGFHYKGTLMWRITWHLVGTSRALEELWSATAGRWLLILAKCHSCGFRERPMQEWIVGSCCWCVWLWDTIPFAVLIPKHVILMCLLIVH